MRYILLSFIGIAINIWSGVPGGGSGPPPIGSNLLDAQGVDLLDAQGDNLESAS